MQGVAAQAAIGQEPVTRSIQFAITGDPCTDLMAGITMLIKTGGDISTGQVIIILDTMKRLYEHAADEFEKSQVQRKDLQKMMRDQLGSPSENEKPSGWDTVITGGTTPLGPDPEWRAKVISEMVRNAPDIKPAPGPNEWPEDGSVMKGPMGWPVDEHH